MSTFFPVKLKKLGYCGLPRWMIDKDFSTVDMIFVPVNVKNNHWSLVVVNTKTFVLKLY
jgi:Ulp1 family protease